MASEDGVIAITVEDVTVDRSATKDDVVDRPRVRFEDTECEEGTATGAKQNSYDGSENPAEAPSSQTISQHNGSSSSSSSVHKHPPSQHRQHVRRDDTPPLDQQSLLLAATLVMDAKAGRNLAFRTGEKYIRSYILYHKFYLRYLLYFFIILNLSLAFFEKPALKGASLPFWGSMLIELVCLVFFLYRKLHVCHFQEARIFWRDTKNYMVLGTIVLTVIDMIVYISWINLAPDMNPVRWSRPLRVLFIINFSDGKQIRRAFRNIRRTVPDIMHVLILFVFSVLLFSLLALKLFYKRDYLVYPDGQPYFKTYDDAIWDLYVLVTTANDPDVI